MDLKDYRDQIDTIDDDLVRLFVKRMEISAKVADYKKEHNMPIHVPSREREILQDVADKAGAGLDNYARVLYSMIFELSRSYQRKRNTATTELHQTITSSIENTPSLFPQSPMVACQGVEGAYSQIACEKIFRSPLIMYFKNFDGIFQAIDKGLCQYGILPIENSTAGSVNQVYDLMMKHNFHIVRSVRIKIDHSLMAKKGVKKSDIKEVTGVSKIENLSGTYNQRWQGKA